MKKKKAQLLVSTVIRVILAIAVVVIMFLLIARLFSPSFNEADQTSKSYFTNLISSIKQTDSSGSSDFFMLDNNRKNLNFYLVYFGSVSEFKAGGKIFSHGGSGQHIVCICSEYNENIVCSHCKNEEIPLVFSKDVSKNYWEIGDGIRIKIKKQDGQYVFTS